MTLSTKVSAAAGGFVVLASSAFLVIRVGAQETTPVTLAGIRFLSASIGFGALAWLTRGLVRVDFKLRDLPLFVLTGATGSVIYSLALIKGQQTASAGTASLIGATIPIWASVMAVSLGKERLTPGAWLGVTLAFIGTLIITVDPATVGRFNTGAAFILCAAVSNAVYFVSVKRLVIRYGALSAVAGTVWMGTILYIPFMFWMESPATWTVAGTGSGLFLGLCATLAGASLFAYVIGKVGAARASTVAYLVAPMVVLFEWVIFADPPGTELVTGGAFTLTGLFLVRPRFKKDRTMHYKASFTKEPDSEIHVREAIPRDIPDLVDLTRQLAVYQNLDDRFGATEAGIRAGLFGRHRSAEALVAEIGDRLVGYSIFATSFSSTICAPKLIVEDVFVAPDVRGRGVGSALFAAIARRARLLGAGKIEWTVLQDNDQARTFYLSLGAVTSPEWVTCFLEKDAIHALCGDPLRRRTSRTDTVVRDTKDGTQPHLAECG